MRQLSHLWQRVGGDWTIVPTCSRTQQHPICWLMMSLQVVANNLVPLSTRRLLLWSVAFNSLLLLVLPLTQLCLWSSWSKLVYISVADRMMFSLLHRFQLFTNHGLNPWKVLSRLNMTLQGRILVVITHSKAPNSSCWS